MLSLDGADLLILSALALAGFGPGSFKGSGGAPPPGVPIESPLKTSNERKGRMGE